MEIYYYGTCIEHGEELGAMAHSLHLSLLGTGSTPKGDLPAGAPKSSEQDNSSP